MASFADLEKTVTAEIESGKFCIDNACALFKSYNLNKAYNKDLILSVLFRALAAFDTSDFDALYVQLPTSFTVTMADEKAALVEMDSALHSAHFAAFWANLEANKAKIGAANAAKAAKFEEAVRATIAQQLARCVVSAAEKDIADALNVPTKELAKVLAPVSATVAGGKVTFPANNTNNGGAAKKAADVTLEKLVKLQQ